MLVEHFLHVSAKQVNTPVPKITDEGMLMLTAYNWPGNIRELQNIIERSVILTNGSALTVAVHELIGKPITATSHARSSESSAHAAERERILRALREANGVVAGPNGAAARLGLKRTTLQSRMRKYQISRQYR